jgi:hypothetical protein
MKKIYVLFILLVIVSSCKNSYYPRENKEIKKNLKDYFEEVYENDKVNLFHKALTLKDIENNVSSKGTSVDWKAGFFKKAAKTPPNTLLVSLDSVFRNQSELLLIKNKLKKSFIFKATLIENEYVKISKSKLNTKQISIPIMTLNKKFCLIFSKNNEETSNGEVTLRIFKINPNKWEIAGVFVF